MATPAYDPPYESPIEDIFAINVVKYLHEDTDFDKQVEVRTIAGAFRLDFVIRRNGKRVAVECDGRDFHDDYRDEWRDAMIFGADAVDVIYRLPGCCIFSIIEHVLQRMAKEDTELFSDRGQIILDKLASNSEAADLDRLQRFKEDREFYERETRKGLARLSQGMLFSMRQTRVAQPGQRVFWPYYYNKARDYLSKGICCLDEMIAAHMAELRQSKERGPK